MPPVTALALYHGCQHWHWQHLLLSPSPDPRCLVKADSYLLSLPLHTHAHTVKSDVKESCSLSVNWLPLCVLAEWGDFSKSSQASPSGFMMCWRGDLMQIIKGPSEALIFSRWFSTPPEFVFSKVFDSKEERETCMALCWSLVPLTRWHTDQSYVKKKKKKISRGHFTLAFSGFINGPYFNYTSLTGFGETRNGPFVVINPVTLRG